MKKKHLFLATTLLVSVFSLVAFASAQKPEKPTNLKVSAVGHKVTLSWGNPTLGETLVSNGFEVNDEKASSLEVDGWSVKTTNESVYSCTWFNYPTSEFLGIEGYEILIHSGTHSAVVFPDAGGNHEMHQDEWLISPVMKKAAYLEFSSFVDPLVLEYSQQPDYPDHYVVMVSQDGGKTWEEIWELKKNADLAGGWQTFLVGLTDKPTDSMRIAFRAYGDYQFDEYGDTINQSLYGAWAIDDVTISTAPTSTPEELLSSDFESGESTDMSFTPDNWTTQIYNIEDMSSWFKNDPANEELSPMVIEGTRSAMILPDNSGFYQDEWLVSPLVSPSEGKTLTLNFTYLTSAAYMDPETGFSYDDPQSSYEVKISKDGGMSWEKDPIWILSSDKNGHMTEDGMFYTNTVKVVLNTTPTDKVKIAFHAQGTKMVDEETGDEYGGINGLWVVDNVSIVAEDGSAVVSSYKVAIDGNELTEGLQATSYIDVSEKTAGKHTYSVYSMTASGLASDPATIDVNLCEIYFAPPRNFECKSALDESTGRYSVRMTWDSAISEFPPTCYNIYNGNLIFAFDQSAENGREGVEMTNCFGIYEFSIEAAYEYPTGTSERIVKRLALGVRFGVTDLTAEANGNEVELSWTAPQEDGYPMGSYTVYRGEEKIAEGITSTSFKDAGVKDGYYNYTVIAVYADQVESVRTSVYCQVGEEVRVELPYFQYFNTTFCPADWRINNHSLRTPDRYIWYFDDQSRLGIHGEGFGGCYAAIDCIDAPGYTRNASLQMPAIDLASVIDRSTITLSFNYVYANNTSFSPKVGTEWSVDGVNWYEFDLIDNATAFNPSEVGDGNFIIQRTDHCIGNDEEILAAVEAAETLYIRFRYSASRSLYFAIDNVVVASDDKVATEFVNSDDDLNVRVAAQSGWMMIHATQPVQNVEIYAVNGAKILEQKGNNSMFMTLDVDYHGLAIVRVTTSKGIKIVKILL